MATASTLPGLATCFTCVPDGYKKILNLYLLSQVQGQGLTPQAVETAAAGFDRIQGGLKLAAKNYLLALITGQSTTPQTLITAASCFFSCIPDGNRADVETYLYAVAAGGSLDPTVLVPASAAWQLLKFNTEKDELYLLANIAGVTNVNTILAGAACFACLSNRQNRDIGLYLLSLGLGINIVPPGATYTGGLVEYDLTVLANTEYIITWGSNDLYVIIGTDQYNSTGTGTQIIVYSGPNTVFKFFGTFAGTTVTVRVVQVANKIPAGAGLSLTSDGSGNVIASWTAPPAQAAATTTQVWTSTDNVTFSLNQTVSAATVTANLGQPSAGSIVYCKIRYCNANGCGSYSPVAFMNWRVPDWVRRVGVNGGATPSANTILAASTFVNSLVTFGLDSMIYVANFFAADNLIAALTPLYKNGGSDPWTNHNFVLADLTVNGLVGDGATKYLDTGITQGAFTTFYGGTDTYHSCGVALYNVTGNNNSEYDFGCANAAFQDGTGLGISQLGNSEWDNPYGTGGVDRCSAANGLWTGYLSGQRLGVKDAKLYKAKSNVAHTQIASNVTDVTGSPSVALNLFCHAVNNNGPAAFFTTKRISFAAMTQGMTAAQSANFFTAIQNLRQSLGGGYV